MRLSFKSNIAKAKIKKILETITTKQHNNHDLSKIICLNSKHCRVYLSHLLKTKQIYISSWKKKSTKTSYIYVPYYKKGSKENAVKPPPISVNEKYRIYNQRRKMDKDRYEEYLHKRRIRHAKKTIQPKSDWVSSWIKPKNTSSLNGQQKPTLE